MPDSAIFSPDQRYRYTLHREWMYGDGTVAFVMLNPSTADHRKNDATVRRCIYFAQSWGFQRLTVVNLFALRSTDHKRLTMVNDPIGPQNDAYIVQEIRRAETVVAAWGRNGTLYHRDRHVLDIISASGCRVKGLSLTNGGHPSHPLRLPKSLYPQLLTDLAQ